MKALNMRYVAAKEAVPSTSRTATLWKCLPEGKDAPVEGLTDPGLWFEKPFYSGKLWEEAMALGNTGLVLTYLTLDSNL